MTYKHRAAVLNPRAGSSLLGALLKGRQNCRNYLEVLPAFDGLDVAKPTTATLLPS